jgi:hypothetical protein
VLIVLAPIVPTGSDGTHQASATICIRSRRATIRWVRRGTRLSLPSSPDATSARWPRRDAERHETELSGYNHCET